MTDYQQMMDTRLKAANLYGVPLETVMPCAMLHNWRRRTKRLDRAIIKATGAYGNRDRVDALIKARHRLTTGRLHP